MEQHQQIQKNHLLLQYKEEFATALELHKKLEMAQ